jgi:putative phosphoesterase
MRIGVVSDTHDNLDNVERIVTLFEAARVDRVVHTGDITQAKTLAALGRLSAPLVGVYGNNDLERTSLETAAAEQRLGFVDPPLLLEWSGRRIVVVHDPRDHDPAALRGRDVILHGHTHRSVIERSRNRITFNPGECAGLLRGHNTIGVLDLPSLDVELLYF